jgi:hypothetical protein
MEQEISVKRKWSFLVMALGIIAFFLAAVAFFSFISILGISALMRVNPSEALMAAGIMKALMLFSRLPYILVAVSLFFGCVGLLLAWRKGVRKILPAAAIMLAVLELLAVRKTINPIQTKDTYAGNVSLGGHPTVLMEAAKAGQTEEVRRILKDPKETSSDQAACALAVKYGHFETVQAFLEEDPDIARNKAYLGELLNSAIESNHIEIVQYLVQRGADLEQRGIDGWTPLMFAAHYGNEAVVDLLIKEGADIHARNVVNATPLIMAAFEGRSTVVGKLLDSGADINAKTADGYTALMAACNNGDMETVKLLVNRGADTSVRDRNNHTAMGWAARMGKIEIVRWMKSAGVTK